MSLENNITCELYYKILNGMPHGVVVADKHGKFILWNKSADPVFNSKTVESSKSNWIKDFGIYKVDKKELFKDEDIPMNRALRGESVNGEKMFVKNTNVPNGIFLKISSYPIYEDNGVDIKAAVIIFDDITKEQILYEIVIKKINELENYLKNTLNIDYNMILDVKPQ